MEENLNIENEKNDENIVVSEQNNENVAEEPIQPTPVQQFEQNYIQYNTPNEMQVKPQYPPVSTQVITKKRNGGWMAIAVMSLLLCAVTVIIAYILIVQGNQNAFKSPIPQTPVYQQTRVLNYDDLLDKPSVIAKLKPSVVNIICEIEGTRYYEGGTASGTGFFFMKDGTIITNAHVIEGAKSIKVVTLDGKEHKATVIGQDSLSDIAVIKIESNDYEPVEIGDSSQLVEGEEIIAMGSPYGLQLSHTSTTGIVSAIRNNFKFDNLNIVLDLVQHDAAINMGNSGGPLINMYGQVIGINSLKIGGEYENLGFAIQINSALGIIEDLINDGSVNRPIIGIMGQTEVNVGGVAVESVSEGGPAETAGIKAKDIITKIDGDRVKSIEELINFISKHDVGETVTLTILRDGETMLIDVILGSN